MNHVDFFSDRRRLVFQRLRLRLVRFRFVFDSPISWTVRQPLSLHAFYDAGKASDVIHSELGSI